MRCAESLSEPARSLAGATERAVNAVDASVLLMPLVLFLGPKDPRMVSTVDRVMKDLTADALVYRYRLNQSLPLLAR